MALIYNESLEVDFTQQQEHRGLSNLFIHMQARMGGIAAETA